MNSLDNKFPAYASTDAGPCLTPKSDSAHFYVGKQVNISIKIKKILWLITIRWLWTRNQLQEEDILPQIVPSFTFRINLPFLPISPKLFSHRHKRYLEIFFLTDMKKLAWKAYYGCRCILSVPVSAKTCPEVLTAPRPRNNFCIKNFWDQTQLLVSTRTFPPVYRLPRPMARESFLQSPDWTSPFWSGQFPPLCEGAGYCPTLKW